MLKINEIETTFGMRAWGAPQPFLQWNKHNWWKLSKIKPPFKVSGKCPGHTSNEETFIQENTLHLGKNSENLWQLSHNPFTPLSQLPLFSLKLRMKGDPLHAGAAKNAWLPLSLSSRSRNMVTHPEGQVCQYFSSLPLSPTLQRFNSR